MAVTRYVTRASCMHLPSSFGIILLTTMLGAASPAPSPATDASARRVLKQMSDYLAQQKSLAARYDVDLDVITPDVEKLQFSASGDLSLQRPDRLRVTRTGGYSDVELLFDGRTATIVDRHGKRYGQLTAPGSTDQLIDRLRGDYGVEMPGADLLLSKSYDELMEGVLEARHVGRGVVDGVECEHLAFRNFDTDWQIWIRVGERPLPCKYVITTKTLAAAPQYTIRLREWREGQPRTAEEFAFRPPRDARPVDFRVVSTIGELPPPVSPGEAK